MAGEKQRSAYLLAIGFRIRFVLLMVAIALGAEAIVEGQDGNYITAAVLALAGLGMAAGWRALS